MGANSRLGAYSNKYGICPKVTKEETVVGCPCVLFSSVFSTLSSPVYVITRGQIVNRNYAVKYLLFFLEEHSCSLN